MKQTRWQAPVLVLHFARATFGDSRSPGNIIASLVWNISVAACVWGITSMAERFRRVYLLGPLALLVCLLLLLILARRAAARPNIQVDRIEQPRPCRALILFLSPKENERGSYEALTDGDRGQIGDQNIRKKFQGPWRMPIEAIAFHQSRLEKLVVIPSSDEGGSIGTYGLVDEFARVVRQLMPRPLTILPLGEVDSKWKRGVAFENAEELVPAIDRVYRKLLEDFKQRDIMIDITGGQKLPTIAGAAIALADGRLFEYVSPRQFYAVDAYDITYRTGW